MQINIKTNAAEVSRWLNGKSKKIAQAAKTALSKTVLQVQHAERVELNKEFTIRKAAFIRNRVKITKFPKVDSLTAVIGIDDNVKGSPLLLAQFEEGGNKQPVQGQRVAVPITGGKARPAFPRAVAPSLRMDKLPMQQGRGGMKTGPKRTVILPTKGGGMAMFQRVGKGKSSELRPLYVFRNGVRLKKRLRFVKTASDLANEQLPKLFNRYLKLYIKG